VGGRLGQKKINLEKKCHKELQQIYQKSVLTNNYSKLAQDDLVDLNINVIML
jgi:hypothetical protein